MSGVDSANDHVVVQFSEYRLNFKRKSRELQSDSTVSFRRYHHFDSHVPTQSALEVVQHLLLLAFGEQVDFADS
jgi:hypothetical protein